MKGRTLALFVGPSVLMMLVFIALPLASVAVQSFRVVQPIVERQEVETCTAGFLTQSCTTSVKTVPVIGEDGRVETTARWVGLESYANLVQPGRVAEVVADGRPGAVLRIDFWRAMRFTLTFTLITLPLVIGLGLAIALAVNNAARAVRGQVIFVSLLPFIITPVIGALSIRWLFYGDGILTAALERITGSNISVAANGWAVEMLMMTYRVWHVAPFAFVIFYAGLQTVNRDTLESAIMDGASRLDRLRYVIVPHLMPLIVFVTLIHLMDAYRAFEEVVGFSSQAQRITLQWLTYDLLTPDDAGNRAISRASASAMLTMLGIVVILIWPLRSTWRDFRRG